MATEKTNLFIDNFIKMMHWISKGNNPAATDALAAEEGNLQKLLGLLLEERETNIKKTFKIDRWEMSQWAIRCREFNREQACRHLKGGRFAPRIARRDYAVSFHTFVNGESRIKCLLGCGFEVWNRPGWVFKWQHGMRMVKQSTNTQTSSEVTYRPSKRTISINVGFPYDGRTDNCVDIGDENPIRGMKVNR